MERIPRPRRLRRAIKRLRIPDLLVATAQRGIRRGDGGLGGEGDAVLGGGVVVEVVLEDDVLGAVGAGAGAGAGEGGAGEGVGEFVGFGAAVAAPHGGPAAAAAGAGARAVVREQPAGAHALHAAPE